MTQDLKKTRSLNAFLIIQQRYLTLKSGLLVFTSKKFCKHIVFFFTMQSQLLTTAASLKAVKIFHKNLAPVLDLAI